MGWGAPAEFQAGEWHGFLRNLWLLFGAGLECVRGAGGQVGAGQTGLGAWRRGPHVCGSQPSAPGPGPLCCESGWLL